MEPRVGWLFHSLPSGSILDRVREVWPLALPGLLALACSKSLVAGSKGCWCWALAGGGPRQAVRQKMGA